MKKIFLFFLLLFPLLSKSQCNLSVNIDSIVVRPCALIGGGSCGCGNTLWAVVTGGTPPYRYLWTPSGATTDTLEGACYVEFEVVVIDTNGCIATDSINVVIPSIVNNIEEYESKIGLNVYPNPSYSDINVEFNLKEKHSITIAVTDLLGKTIDMIPTKMYVKGNIKFIIVYNYRHGTYLININVDNNIITKKVIIN